MKSTYRTGWVLALTAFAVLTGCGDSAESAAAKRLPEGGPCDLATGKDVGRILGVDDIVVEPTDKIQCDYRSTSKLSGANVIRSQDLSKMNSGQQVDLDGVPGQRMRQSSDSFCGVSVVLAKNVPAQRFGVAVTAVPSKTKKPACQIADELAVVILQKLPA